jgi:phenylacetate-CoA ligase
MIYNYLPPILQDIALSVYGIYWKNRRFGGNFKKYVSDFNNREFYSEEQWQDYQSKELQKVLKHAFSNVPYYNKRFIQCGIGVKELEEFSIDRMNELPMLTKEDLRKFGQTELMANNFDRKGGFLNSSGSTGTPVSIYYSYDLHRKWNALCESRMRSWAGINYEMPRAMIGGRKILGYNSGLKKNFRFNYSEKQMYISAYHIYPESLNQINKALLSHKIEYMTGYAYSNYVLAKLFLDSGIQPPKMKAVLVSSEMLTKEMRKTLQEAYKCPVFDAYSGVEACGLISESPEGQLLFSPDSGIMEVLESGEVVFTGLLNYDQPLIRYRIGDVIKLSEELSLGGRCMPVIKEIIGRTEDEIIGVNGNRMVRFHSLYYGIPNIQRAQFQQLSIGKYKVVYEAERVLNDAEKQQIIKAVDYQLGSTDVSFEHVENIPLTRNGKFKSVIIFK